MQFRLIAPEAELFDGEVAELRLPTPSGPITVLPGHMPLVTPVAAGVVTLLVKPNDAKPDHFAVGGGMLSVHNNVVELTAETAEHVDSIDEHRAHQALAQAQAELEAHTEEDQLIAARGIVERNLARIAARELRRK